MLPAPATKCSLDEVPSAGGSGEGGSLLEIRRLEELMGKRMERQERQLSELRQEVRQGPSNLKRSYTDNMDENDPGRDPEDLTGVTPMRLDWSDTYILQPSTWDASLFAFHPCVGSLASAITVFASCANITLQAWFCWLVLSFMSTPTVTEATLDGLLRFRMAAHSVEFADELTQQSMVSIVCNGGVPGKLTMAAGQSALLKALAEFSADDWGGGRSFMSLALIIWLCFNMVELHTVYHFARSLTHIGLGDRTRISMMGGADESVCASVSADVRTAFGGAAVGVTSAPCRVVCVSPRRFWSGMLFIVLPRLVLVLIQSYMGCIFLGNTSTNEDLVLNAMALAFIADIDKVMYSVLAPRRIQTLITNLEAFPMAHVKEHRHSSGLLVLGKVTAIAGALILLYFFKLEAFWWRLDMAEKVLCSGNQDFVWGINQASGMVHVTRSNDLPGTAWVYNEKAILQVVAPDIGNKFWNIDDHLMGLADTEEPLAVWEPSASSYGDAAFDSASFKFLRAMHDFTVSDAGAALDCNDASESDISLIYLRELLGNESIQTCWDISWQTCAAFDSDQVRSICPQRCGCDLPPRYDLGTGSRPVAGFYQGPAAGCPQQCKFMAAAVNEILYSGSDYSYSQSNDAANISGIFSCTDVDEADFTFYGDCSSADQDTNSTNSVGQTCATAACSSDYDDADFSADTMCCRCGGGLRYSRIDSVSCMEQLVDECMYDLPQTAFFYTVYVRGMVDYLVQKAEYRLNVAALVRSEWEEFLQIADSQVEPFVEWMLDGNFALSLADGNWNLMPGVPHPRQLTGCEYLASFEITFLLGFDICDDSEYGSLKMFCPETCGCRSAQYEIQSEDGEEDILLNMEGTSLIYSYDRGALRNCPAACVLPHPQVTGASEHSDYSDYSFLNASTG